MKKTPIVIPLLIVIAGMLLSALPGCENPSEPPVIDPPLFAFVANADSLDVTKILMTNLTETTMEDTIGLSPNPFSITYWHKKVAVLSRSPNAISFVNLDHLIVEKTLALPGNADPGEMVLFGDKWGVINYRGTSTISVWDMTINEMAPHPGLLLDGGIEGFAIDDSLLFVAGGTSRYVPSGEDSVEVGVVKVVRFGDLARMTEIGEIYTPLNPKLVAMGSGDGLFVASWTPTFPCQVYAITIDDTLAATLTDTLQIGGRPDLFRISEAGVAYLLEIDVGIMSFNANTMEVLYDSDDPLFFGEHPSGMAVDDESDLYVCLPESNELVILSSSGVEEHRIELEGGPTAVITGR